ncbi:hypothetical protein J9253_16955 [Thiothrix litoralis]|jgi:hypothetical protein|uniref:Uncharacterized protein n=1 Tax=Thiothrix litoralis TaxID=2891210 RepID=A0ABX7WT49_9GAMM|nr:hypothetical protein [Thiothrix litoralis]QTR45673.1 hypothetical protein J9253_16955 [Thiothrix litoralis]
MNRYGRWRECLLAACLVITLPSYAGERLDDSASPRSRVEAPQAIEIPDTTQVVLKFGQVDYKLATANFVGKQARIDYVIPASIPGLVSPNGLLVEWRGNAPFESGTGRPGDRVLVWTGIVSEAWMSTRLDLTMQVDLAALRLPSGVPFGFESYFEIEVLP